MAKGRSPRLLFLAFTGGALLVLLVIGLAHSLRSPWLWPSSLRTPHQAGSEHTHAQSSAGAQGLESQGGYENGTDITILLTPEQKQASQENMRMEHVEVRSNMTKDGRWFMIDFRDQKGYNPSMIPHPRKENTWIAIAQRSKVNDEDKIWRAALYCEVTFVADSMKCTQSPLILPIASTVSPVCVGDLEYMNEMIGPHDARILYGPDKPYIVYGSQAEQSCIGQWMQDLRRLVNWSPDAVTHPSEPFFWPTNVQRPVLSGEIEKNWFPFWNAKGEMFLHYDIYPDRSFARVGVNGTVGEDLAGFAAAHDRECMNRLMPSRHKNGLEWLHQSTNSLSISLCKRSDPECERNTDNTLIFVLFQKKTFYMHGVYEPYALLFRQTAPFQVYAISSKPIWYTGRGRANGNWTNHEEAWKPKDQSEMVFTTSMAWKNGETFHGYLDDEVIVTFGIEDSHAGGIDVVAEDLLQELAYCE